MPVLTYESQPYRSSHAATIADLILRPGEARARGVAQAGDAQARGLAQVGEAQARAQAASGEAWANATRGIGQAVGGFANRLGDPKVQLEQQAVTENVRKENVRAKFIDILKTTPPIDEDGMQLHDTNAIMQRVAAAGVAGPADLKDISETIDGMNSRVRVQRAATLKVAEGMMQAVERANYDPTLALHVIDYASKNHALPQGILDQFRLRIVENPTAENVKNLVKFAGGKRDIEKVGPDEKLYDVGSRESVFTNVKPVAVTDATTRAMASGWDPTTGKPPTQEQAKAAAELQKQTGAAKAIQQEAVQLLMPNGEWESHYVSIDPTPGAKNPITYRGEPIDQSRIKRAVNEEVIAATKFQRDTLRADQQYHYSDAQFNKMRDPLTQQTERLSRAMATANQRTSTADALMAPEILTAIAGGGNTGFRMSEAEMARLLNSKSHWQKLYIDLLAWNTDPSQVLKLNDSQRDDMRTLIREISKGALERLDMIHQAKTDLIGMGDNVDQMRTHTETIQKKYDEIAGANLRSKGTLSIAQVKQIAKDSGKDYETAKDYAESQGYTVGK